MFSSKIIKGKLPQDGSPTPQWGVVKSWHAASTDPKKVIGKRRDNRTLVAQLQWFSWQSKKDQPDF
jgi:hypothetical protein